MLDDFAYQEFASFLTDQADNPLAQQANMTLFLEDPDLNAGKFGPERPCIGWINDNFGDCVSTTTEIVSFVAGNLSLICFIVAFLPQLYKNYKRGSVSGVSVSLLISWGLGDAFGFVSTLLTPQFFSQRALAAYFVFLDVLVLAQFAYYSCFAAKKGAAELEDEDEGRTKAMSIDIKDGSDPEERIGLMHPPRSTSSPKAGGPTFSTMANLPSMTTLVTLCVATCCIVSATNSTTSSPSNTTTVMAAGDSASAASINYSPISLLIGSIMAWISGSCYFIARIPQLLEHYRMKSVTGISLAVFACTIVGNIFYGISICLRVPEFNGEFVQFKMPYLIGSVGTLVFDGMMFYQAHIYNDFFGIKKKKFASS